MLRAFLLAASSLALGFSPQGTAQTGSFLPSWAQQSPATSPPVRDDAAMAYDPATGQLVLFGGINNSGTLNDTWTYNGVTWIQQSPTNSPSARCEASMAYDSASGQLLLFGGLNGSSYSNDTWVWTGSNWTQLSPASSPSSRYLSAMAYDAVTSSIVLFGGTNTSALSDTWTWNGTTWTLQSPMTSPAARYGSAAVFDAATNQFVLFGGRNGSGTFLSDTWTWNGTNWTPQSPTTSPSARDDFAFAYDPGFGQPVLYGGYGGSYLTDTWTWNGTNWTQLSPSANPTSSFYPSMAFDPTVGDVLFGGTNSSNTFLNATWTLFPGAVNLGTANICSGSQTTPSPCTQTATLTFYFNTGGKIHAPTVVTQGATGLDFTDAGTGTCTTNGTSYSYSSGSTCMVVVQFAPKNPGLRLGGVTISNSSGTPLATLNIYGTGTGPQVTYSPPVQSTVGPSTPSTSNFEQPDGIAVDASGDVFIADYQNNNVKEMVAVGGSVPSSPTINTIATGFDNPSGVAVDGIGNIFVADQNHQEVKEIPYVAGAYGTPVVLVSALNEPSGVAVDGNGNLFFSDSFNNLVKEATASSGYTKINILASANGHFSNPYGVALDGSGNLYVGDSGNNAVKEITAASGYVTVNTLGSGFAAPQSVAVDAAGDVFVGDANNNKVKEMIAVGGSIPSSSAINILGSGFDFPAGVAVGGNGNVYATDLYNHRVEALTFATPPSLSFATTNEGSVSTDSPKTVTINNDGNASLIFAVPGSGNNPSISTNFTIGASSTCPQLTGTSSTASLAAGSSCTDLISFAPVTSGSISGSLITTDNNLNTTAATQTIPLSGTATYMVPTVTSISPAKGPPTGGNFVTITGTYFTGATAVMFGTVAGTSVTIVNSTTITVISPAGTGTVDVTVTTPYGTSPTSTADQFTYNASAPTITSMSPNSGPTTGGPEVTIIGTNIDNANSIYFGSVPLTGWAGSGTTELFFNAPPNAAGTVNVVVTNSYGTSAISSITQYTYIPVSQTITFPALSNQLTTAVPFTVSATASSGLPVSYYVESATAEGWAAGASMPTAVQEAVAGAPGDGMIYVAGGYGSSGRVATLEQYNPATQTWASMASMPTGVYQAAAASIGGLFYVAGGWNGSLPSTLLQAYNPSSNTWTTLASMSHDSACGIAGAINNLLYVTTACNGFSGYSALLDVYNPATNTWSSLAASPQAHAGGAGGVINGKLYIAGGYNSTGTPTTELDAYNPTTNTWATLAAMPVALSGLSGDVIDGKLYVLGYTASASQTELYIYDPVANSWSTQTLSPLSLGVTSSAAVAFGGDLFVAGGSTVSSGNPSSSFEILNTNACSNSGNTITILGAGICTVTATQVGNTTYNGATPVSQSFTITPPAPTLTAVSPSAGPIAGGTTVTITGTNFTGATAVAFGSTAATSFTVVNSTTITATSPAEAAATVDITVTTPGGTTATNSADHFTYTAIPTVTAVAPNAGPFPGGTTVTITGTNLTSATAVKFGTVAATSFSVVSATSITAVSPAEAAGTVDITVTTPGGTTTTSTADHFTYGQSITALASSGSTGNYTLTATVDRIGSQTLSPSGNVSFIDTNNSNYLLGTGTLGSGTASLFANIGNTATGTSNSAVATADFNGDGIPDLVVTGNPTTILLGNGDGTYRSGQTFTVGGGATYSFVVTGDFNNDGKPDLAMVDGEGYTSGTVAIFLGNGDGTFTAGTTPTTGPEPNSIAVADFNKDGNLDLAITNNYNSTMTILLGDGHGNFTTKSTPSTGYNTFPDFVAVGYFNADSYPDLVVANDGAGSITIFTGNGDGTFTTGSTYSTGSGYVIPKSIAVGDFNGDGKSDIAVANFDGQNVAILLGNGNGTFTAGTTQSAGLSPESIVTADFNGDGKLDLAVSNRDSNNITVLLGNGSGGFTASPNVFIGTSIGGLVAADVNRDGRTDLIVCEFNGNAVTTLLNEPNESATASITGVSIVGNTSHNIEAVFPGDTNYSASTSGAVSLNAQQIQTTITLTSTAGASVPQGQSVTFTATVSPYGGNQNHTTNGDTVTFYSQSTGSIGTGTLSNGVATLTTSSLPAGSNTIYAYYTGDPNYIAYSSSNTITIVVVGTTATTLSITSGSPATVVTSVASGSVVTLTASVKVGATAVTTGQVNFCNAAATYCTDINLLGTAQLTSAGTASIKFIPGIGSHSYKAVFVADSTDSTSASAASPLTVTGSTTGPYPTATSIGYTGSTGSYTLTATVVGTTAAGVAPSGTVSFEDTTNSNYVLATANLGSGTAGIGFTNPNSTNPATGNDPIFVAVADFNGDGQPDLAVSNQSGDTVSILLGNGAGTFTAASPITLPLHNQPRGLAVGDFNGDGIPDLAVTNTYNNAVDIYLGVGNGTFTTGSTPSTGGTPYAIAVGDFNGDGKADLAVANFGGENVTILLGNGSGTFTAASGSPLTAGTLPTSIAVGDFNNDGIPDLVVANATSATVSVFLGNGDGTFQAQQTFPVGSYPVAVGVGDFTGNGNLDLAVSNATSNSISILLGNGHGSFTAASPLSMGSYSPDGLTVADFNGDGIPDLAVVANTGPGFVNVFLGDGSGGFTSTATPSTGTTTSPYAVAAGDFNGDGRTDIVAADTASNAVTILLNQVTQTVTATASSVSPVGNGSAHLVDAVYPGDSNFTGSTSATVSLTSQLQSTTLTLVPSPASSTSGQSISLAATLSPYTAQNHATTGETVTFYYGSTNLGTATLSSTGIATLNGVNTLPVGTDGLHAVYVTDGYFANATSLVVNETVSTPIPSVTGIAPISGPAIGGTSVTITGTTFTGATAVTFGTTAATSFTVVNATTITATSPAGTGTINVTVTTPGGTSATSAADQFTYIAAPTITSISPTSGPTSGGTSVTITGTTFTGATAVTFGTTAATSFTVVNATTITATSPAGTGTINVTVTTPGGTSATTAADQFTYIAPATHFTVMAPSSATAGTSFSVTITAVDAGNNVVTSYAGTVKFSSSDSAATLPSNSTLTNGTGIFTVTLKTAGPQTISATDTTTSTITGTSPTITVSAGAVNHYNLAAPATATAGVSTNLTLTALDAYNNTVTTYTGPVNITSSDSLLSTSPTSPITLVSGVKAISATLKTAGTQTITFTDASTSNLTATATINVSPAATSRLILSAPSSVTANTAFSLTVTAQDSFGNTTPAYSGTVTFTSSDSSATLPSPSTLTSGTRTFTNAAKLVTAGSQTITAADSVNSLYSTATIVVGSVTPTITFTIPNHTYGDAPFTIAATSNSSGSFTYSVVSGPATIFGNTVTLTGAGTVVIQASQSASGSYTSGTQNASFTVAPGSPTITFAVPNHTFGDAPFTVAATSNSTGGFTYSVLSGPATILGNTVTLTGSGTVVLQASESATTNYTAGTQNASFTVAVEAPTITFTIPNHTYGDAPFTVAATSNSSGTFTYSIVSGPATILGNTVTLTGTGTVIVKASQAASGNYGSSTQNASFTVASATPTITFTVPNHTFGDAPFAVAATSNSTGAFTYSVVSGPATILGSTVTLTGSGSVTLKATEAADPNYLAGSLTATFSVAAAAPTISFTVPNHTFGDAPFAVVATSNSAGAFTYSVISGPATILGNTVTLTGVGTVLLQASEAANGSYTAGTQTASFTVAAATPTITFSIPNHTFGDAPFTVVATSNSTGAFTYSVVSGPATILGNTVTLTGVGTVIVQASEAASGNYGSGTQNASFTVGAAAPTITFTIPNHTFGDAPFTVAATSNSTGAFTYTVVSGPATLLGNTVTLTGPGTVVIQASQAAAGNYTSGSLNATFTVAPQTTPTITFIVPNHTFGDAPFTVSATSNSAGSFTYSVVSGPASIAGSTVTLTGAGTVVLKATQAASGTFVAGSQTATFTVAMAVPTITFTVPNHSYGDAPFTIAATSNSTGTFTYSVVSGPATLAGTTVTLTGAGTVVLKATEAADPNYASGSQTATFTVTAAVPTINFTIPNHTFGDAPFTVAATSNSSGSFTYSVVSGPATIVGNTVTLTGAGTVVLQASQAASGIYASGTQNASFTVAQESPTINFTVPNHTFGDAPFTVAAGSNSTGAFTYTVLSGPATIVGNTVTLTGAGTVILKATEAADPNYAAGSLTATFTVAKATPVISWPTPASITYGTPLSNTQLDATSTGVAGVTLTGTFAYTPAAGTILFPGPQVLTLQFTPSDTTDYVAVPATTTTITVTQATLTITANNATRVYGTSNPTFTGTISGQQNGDTFTESFTSSAVPLSPVATYPIIPSASGADLADYTQIIQNGTLTVTQAGTTGSVIITPGNGIAGVANAFTATIASQTTGTPTGTVQFFANGTSIGTATLVAGQATLNAALGAGTFTITIVYSGDANFTAGIVNGASAVITVVAPDFTFTPTSPANVTIPYGGTATFNFDLNPLSGIYYQGVTFYYTGSLPSNAQPSFSPGSLSPNAGPATMVFTVITTKDLAMVHSSYGTTATLLCLLGIPLAFWRRGKSRRRWLSLARNAVLLLLASAAMTGLFGCGSGFAAKDYPLVITATSGGGIVHTASVVLHMAQTPQ